MKQNKLEWILGLVCAFVIFPVLITAEGASGSDKKITVLNPQGQPPQTITLTPLSKRLDTLDGKTVYLVDAKFGGGYSFLTEMQGWFSKNMPKVKTVLISKKKSLFEDEPELWAEIKEKGDAIILGVGG